VKVEYVGEPLHPLPSAAEFVDADTRDAKDELSA
jgi:hypothetical protein